MPHRRGKQKAPLPRSDDDASGGGTTSGVIIPLKLVGSGVYDAAYTVPVNIGHNDQYFELQVDTGSSDLWVASTSCSSSVCRQTGGRNYDPSVSGTSTGHNFDIHYLSGAVSGPVWWDRVTVGGYSIENQALAAATSVTDETLTPDFNGILGLALPLNSIIAQSIPPVTSNSPDGAAWSSNLFSITPTSNAPSSRFLSLSLSRPGSDRIPSFLGIGKHPPQLVSDPAQIHYTSVLSDRLGTLFWKANVRDITVYVNGQARPVDIGHSNTGTVFPSAVIDSGVPFILTTSKVANAIYGAIDVHPAQDGNYYVPCKTPLNMTITLDNRPAFPLHPLDLTAEPPKDNQADFCIGLIQAADAQLSHPNSGIGDMILGVPFMRNVYTVMAYTVPNDNGTFPPVANVSVSDDEGEGQQNVNVRPRLGLMNLTNPTTALAEFNTVRVLNQPLSDSPLTPDPSHPGGKKLSVGLIVLISLLGFFALCCTLFLLRWLLYRRRFKRQRQRERNEGLSDSKRALAYQLARRDSITGGMPSEDTLRTMRYEAYLKQERATSFSSTRTRGTQDQVDEFGAWRRSEEEEQDWNGDTLVTRKPTSPPENHQRDSTSTSSPERIHPHRRTQSEMEMGTEHDRTMGVSTPLLDEVYPH